MFCLYQDRFRLYQDRFRLLMVNRIILEKVGGERTLEDAQGSAKICPIYMLAAVKDYIGDLDRVVNVVKRQGFVSSEVGFDCSILLSMQHLS